MSPHEIRHKSQRRRALMVLAVIAVGAAGIIGLRMHQAMALRNAVKENAVLHVAVVTPRSGPANEELVLPGNVQAWHEAPIYARTGGYLKQWKVDIGSRVKAGDLLAEIEAPELDAQLRQAEAELNTAQANATLAQSTAVRWKALRRNDAVSKQEADEKTSDAAAKAALLASATANRDRLRELASFKRVTAPFDGTIAARNTDTGALINIGSGTGVGPELFHIVDASRLRIYVQVPQTQVRALGPNITAELHFAEHPSKTYTANLLKTADAIEPTSRTLLAQFKINNPGGELLAGGYVQVHVKLPTPEATLRLPVNALIFRAAGLQVARVDSQGNALLTQVTMGRDFGNEVEITSGISAEDRVIVNPPDSLTTGDAVHVVAPASDTSHAALDKKA